MPRLHRPVLSLLAGDDFGAVPIRSTRSSPEPERRCADSRCNCLLARDNPNRFCSPCMRRVSDMPPAIADYLEGA